MTNSTITKNTNATLPSNSTNNANTTIQQFPIFSIVLTGENYTIPGNCTFTDMTNSTVQCNDGAQSGKYSFEEVNKAMENVWPVCAELITIENNCTINDDTLDDPANNPCL